MVFQILSSSVKKIFTGKRGEPKRFSKQENKIRVIMYGSIFLLKVGLDGKSAKTFLPYVLTFFSYVKTRGYPVALLVPVLASL